MSVERGTIARWTAPGWLIATIIAFGAVLRVITLNHQGAVSVDSVRYLTFATNWTQGIYYTTGPTGLREFPDLGYPLLIALVLPYVGDAVAAARLVSLIAGVALLIPLYRVARACYGPHVAFYAVFLAAVSQPLLVTSAQVQTESLYLFWTLVALDAAIATAQRPGMGPATILGFACGMAYLTRGIGVLLFPCVLFFLWWAHKQGGLPVVIEEELPSDPVEHSALIEGHQGVLGMGAGWMAAMAAVLIWFAIPVMAYQIMLNATYGGFTLSDQAIWHMGSLGGGVEARSDDVRLEGTLNASGNDYALNDWFEGGRPSEGGVEFGAIFERYAKNLVGIAYYIPEELLEPVTLLLLALGLFGASPRPRLPRTGWILLGAIAPYVLVQPLVLTLARYLLPAVPVLLIWAARGAVTLQEWAIGRWLRNHPKTPASVLAGTESYIFLTLFVLYMPGMIWPVTHAHPPYQELEAKAAGDWLAAHAPPGGVFATTPLVGYYAGASPNLVLPDSDLAGVLKLATIKGVGYIVVDERRVPRGRDSALTALLYESELELPDDIVLLHEVGQWPGYRVRIFGIRMVGVARIEVPPRPPLTSPTRSEGESAAAGAQALAGSGAQTPPPAAPADPHPYPSPRLADSHWERGWPLPTHFSIPRSVGVPAYPTTGGGRCE